MICHRCSWLVGDGCTCPRDEVTRTRLRRDADERYRIAVARARARRWRDAS